MSEHTAEFGARPCAQCGHAYARHDASLGCCVERGDNGSGSVADTVFCRCPAYVTSPGSGQESQR